MDQHLNFLSGTGEAIIDGGSKVRHAHPIFMLRLTALAEGDHQAGRHRHCSCWNAAQRELVKD